VDRNVAPLVGRFSGSLKLLMADCRPSPARLASDRTVTSGGGRAVLIISDLMDKGVPGKIPVPAPDAH
jgi:hypothetical protein